MGTILCAPILFIQIDTIYDVIEFYCIGGLTPSHYAKNRSPFAGGGLPRKSFGVFSELDSDISFISSGRPSTEHSSPMVYDIDLSQPTRLSTSSDQSFGSERLGIKFNDRNPHEFSFMSQESGRTSCSCSSQNVVSLKFLYSI